MFYVIFTKGIAMSDALYLGMMGSVNQYSAKDKKRMKRSKLMSKLGKGFLYAGAILLAAYGAENMITHISVASVLCAGLECFR